MKNLRIALAVGFLALLTACGNTKNTNSEPKTTIGEQVPNRGRSNTQVISNSRTGTTTNTSTSTTTSETSGSRVTSTTTTTDGNTRATSISDRTAATNEIEAARKAKMQKMYTDLDMNDDQISRFESAWKASTGSWSTRDTSMNSYERIEAQDKIMRDILSDSQFKKYQQWAIDNADARD